MKRYRGLLFDFDYTLADSSAGVRVCVNHALTTMGFPPVGKNRADRTIGLSLSETFRELTGIGEAAKADRFAELFLEKADDTMVDMTVLLPGTAAVIPLLGERGYRMGIVSTKRRGTIRSILRREEIDGCLSTIIGRDDVHMPKPDPEGVGMALTAMGLAPETVLYVGDSETDDKTARNAGVDFAAVLTGVTDPDVFHDAAGVFSDLAELSDALGDTAKP